MSEQLLRKKLLDVIERYERVDGQYESNKLIERVCAALAQPADGGEVVGECVGGGVLWHGGTPPPCGTNLYTVPPASQEQQCAQCHKPYKHGTNKAGCPKCAPGVRIAEVEFQKPLQASQEQAVSRFNWNKGGFEWLVPYSFDKHNMRPLYLAPEHAEAARKAAQEQLYTERERHTAEVKALQAEIGRLKASQEQAQQPQGCDYCNHHLFAGTSCRNCGRVVEKPQAQAQQPSTWSDGTRPPFEPGPMNPEKAAYFMRRFKREEKLLGPNEQAACDFAISLLEAQQPQVQARESDRQLMGFYGVDSLHSLIDAQEKHITKLQAKLPADNQPATTKAREG